MTQRKTTLAEGARGRVTVIGCVAAFALVCAPPRPTGACSCVNNVAERLNLELESVSRDGAPVTDLSPWRGWQVEVAPPPGGEGLQLRAVRGDEYFEEGYSRVP